LTELAVNALKWNVGSLIIPVGLKPGTNGAFTLTAEGTESFDPGTVITLEDLQAGTTRNLMTSPEFIFPASSGDDPGRFRIHFSGVYGIKEEAKQSCCRIYADNQTVYILSDQYFHSGSLTLYNLSGQELLQREITGPGLISIPVNLNPGLYIVKVITNENVQTEKVLIQ
jgi:hypothetical protein